MSFRITPKIATAAAKATIAGPPLESRKKPDAARFRHAKRALGILRGRAPACQTRLPLNLLEALRAFEKSGVLRDGLGAEVCGAYLKLKHDDWNAYARHLTDWERQMTLGCSRAFTGNSETSSDKLGDGFAFVHDEDIQHLQRPVADDLGARVRDAARIDDRSAGFESQALAI